MLDLFVLWQSETLLYVNRFLFETIHQESNFSQVKLCNLLYFPAASLAICRQLHAPFYSKKKNPIKLAPFSTFSSAS